MGTTATVGAVALLTGARGVTGTTGGVLTAEEAATTGVEVLTATTAIAGLGVETFVVLAGVGLGAVPTGGTTGADAAVVFGAATEGVGATVGRLELRTATAGPEITGVTDAADVLAGGTTTDEAFVTTVVLGGTTATGAMTATEGAVTLGTTTAAEAGATTTAAADAFPLITGDGAGAAVGAVVLG